LHVARTVKKRNGFAPVATSTFAGSTGMPRLPER
jgi:hypothetical protein